MRNLHYPPEDSIDGPWLLSSKSLTELDVIINKYWEIFESRREKRLRRDVNDFKKKFTKVEKDLAEVSEEFSQELQDRVNKHKENSPWSISSRSLEIDLKDRTVRSYKNFDEAFRDRYLLDKRLTGFRIALISGNIEFSVDVDSSKMNFKIEPPRDVSEVQEIYTTVYEWAMEIRRHARIQGIWGKAAKQRWKLLIAGLGLPIFLAFANRISASESIKQELVSMSEITNRNVVDAVTLLIQLQKAQEFTPFSLSQNP
jgi:hypothetical protein